MRNSDDYQEEPKTFPVIASTHRKDNGRSQYIRDVPRKIKVNGKMIPKKGYADWEYTDNENEALPLTRYWWRRFRSDMHHCHQCAHYFDVKDMVRTTLYQKRFKWNI